MEPWLERFAQVGFERCSDTAHDLKTPLNIAVLNLELLRMRIRRVSGEEDEKVAGYVKAIDAEIRRLSRIFDAFFVLGYPPKDAPPPVAVAADTLFAEAVGSAGYEYGGDQSATLVTCHEARMRELARLFVSGAKSVIEAPPVFSRSSDETTYTVSATGRLGNSSIEIVKLFKLYYSAPDGTPDLTLASARLIAETYGGDLSADERDGTLEIKLSLPVG
jgi:hypothetical protein